MRAAKENKDMYLAEHQGHKLLVTRVPGGKGYSPYRLEAEGKMAEAARVAASAFKAGV